MPTQKKENLLVNLTLNIVIPTLILTKLSTAHYLGPKWGVVAALIFPLAYGIWDFYERRKFNVFSALGVVSVLLTGGISLLKLKPEYIAIKEAAIPSIIGVITLISVKTPWPLVKTFLYNDMVVQTDKINQVIEERGQISSFNSALKISSLIMATSFFLSAVLNYVLARVIVTSNPGTEAYAVELGKMTAYSYVVITIPSISVLMIAMVYFFRQLTKLTSLPFEELFHDTNTKTSKS